MSQNKENSNDNENSNDRIKDSKTYKLFKLKGLNIDLKLMLEEIKQLHGSTIRLSKYNDFLKERSEIEKNYLKDYNDVYLLWDKRSVDYNTGLEWFYQGHNLTEIKFKNVKDHRESNNEFNESKEINIEDISEIQTQSIDVSVIIQRNTDLGKETYVYVFKGKNYFKEKIIDIEFPQKIYKKTKVSVVNAQKVVSPNDELSTLEARTKGRARSTISGIGQFVSKITFRTSWEPYHKNNDKDKRLISKVIDKIMSESATIDKYFHSSIIGEMKVINLMLILAFLNDDVLKREDKNTDTIFIHPIYAEEEINLIWKEVLSRTNELEERLTLNWKYIISNELNHVNNISKSIKYPSINNENIIKNFEFVENTSSFIKYLKSLNDNLPSQNNFENFINHYINLPTAQVCDGEKKFKEKLSIGSLFDIWDFEIEGEIYYYWEGKWFLNDDTYTSIAKKIMFDELENKNIIINDPQEIWYSKWDEKHFNMKVSTKSKFHYCIDRKLARDSGFGLEVGDLLIKYKNNEYEIVAVKKGKTLGGANYVFDQAKLSLNHNHFFNKIANAIGGDAKITRYSIWIYTSGSTNLKHIRSLSFLIGISTFTLLAAQRGLEFKIYISNIAEPNPNQKIQTKKQIEKNYISFMNSTHLEKRIIHRKIINSIKDN